METLGFTVDLLASPCTKAKWEPIGRPSLRTPLGYKGVAADDVKVFDFRNVHLQTVRLTEKSMQIIKNSANGDGTSIDRLGSWRHLELEWEPATDVTLCWDAEGRFSTIPPQVMKSKMNGLWLGNMDFGSREKFEDQIGRYFCECRFCYFEDAR